MYPNRHIPGTDVRQLLVQQYGSCWYSSTAVTEYSAGTSKYTLLYLVLLFCTPLFRVVVLLRDCQVATNEPEYILKLPH